MTPALLRKIGEALYGERWQSSLAVELGVSDRTVRRWVAGADNPRPGVWQDLHRLVLQRGTRLAALAVELERLSPPAVDN